MDPAPTWSAGRAVLSCSRQTRICSGAHPALVWRQSRRVGPAADGNAQMNRHSAFADAVAALDEGDFELLRRAVDERCCREKHGFGTLAEAADLYRTDPACPSCRAASPFRDGRTAGGADPRVGLRRGGAQGRRQRPGLPGADGHGEQPLLLAQAVPLEVHGHVDVEPPVVPQLVRLPVQGQAGLREMARDRKGGSPFAAHRGAFPQLDIANPSPVS